MKFLGVEIEEDLPSKTVLMEFRQRFFKDKVPEEMFKELYERLT